MPETMPPPAAPAAPSQPAGGDAFESQLESSLGGDLTPSPAPSTPEPAKPAPAAAPVAAKPAEVKPAAPKAAAKPAEKPVEPKPAEPSTGPKALRDELERTRAEAKTNAEGKAALEVKIKEYEEKGKNTDALESRLKEFEVESKKLKAELSAARFETSDQYKEKFEKPFTKLIQKTKAHVNSLMRPDGAGADFDRDFIAVLNTSNNDAPRLARELFGDDHAIDILGRRRQVIELREEANEAVTFERENWETNKKKGEEQQQLQKMQKAQEREHEEKLWVKMTEDLKNAVEDYRDPVDDEELSAARAKGQSIYDHHPQTTEENILKFAHIRHRLGAYEAQKLQIARHVARIAELEGQIEESKVRQPGEAPHKPGGDAVAQKEESFEEAVAAGKWKT